MMRLLFLLGSFGAGCCSGEIPSAEFQELVASRGSWPPSDWSFQLSGNPKVVFLLFSADLKLKNDENVFFCCKPVFVRFSLDMDPFII